MRKDVKFGLTIGAILVVTLVVYVIVLSRGPAVPQKIGVVMPSPADHTADAVDSTPTPSAAPQSTDVADNSTATGTQQPSAVPSAGDSASAPTSEANAATPATQPDATADSKTDWDGALKNGLPPSLSAQAAPEHTVTPMIDSAPMAAARDTVSRAANTPVIDPLPTTQPSNLYASNQYVSDPAPADPIPMVAPAAPRTHRVSAGESPYSIAQSVYGSSRYYKRILAANPGVDPRHLKIGQVLVIPELTDSEKNPVAASAAETHVDSATMYTVVAGDSLESISLKLYGSAGMIDRLYLANKNLIGPDENVLKIGWVLKLPQPPTVASAQR